MVELAAVRVVYREDGVTEMYAATDLTVDAGKSENPFTGTLVVTAIRPDRTVRIRLWQIRRLEVVMLDEAKLGEQAGELPAIEQAAELAP